MAISHAPTLMTWVNILPQYFIVYAHNTFFSHMHPSWTLWMVSTFPQSSLSNLSCVFIHSLDFGHVKFFQEIKILLLQGLTQGQLPIFRFRTVGGCARRRESHIILSTHFGRRMQDWKPFLISLRCLNYNYSFKNEKSRAQWGEDTCWKLFNWLLATSEPKSRCLCSLLKW